MAAITPLMRSYAHNMLKSVAFKYNWGFRKSMRFVRGQLGHVYRNKVALQDFRRWKNVSKYADPVRRLRSTSYIPGHLTVQTDLKRAYKYRVFEDVEIWNPDTGESRWRTMSHFSDRSITKGEYEWEFAEQYNEKYTSKGFLARQVKVWNVWHNEGYPW